MATATPLVTPARTQAQAFARRRIVFATVLVVLAVVVPWIPPFTGEDYRRYLVTAALMAAWAVAFDFTAGYIDIVNFGFAAFVGLGGYTSGLLAVDFGISPWIGMVCGAFVAGLVGLGTGMLTLRLRGIYAAVMAWFVGLALMGLVRNFSDVTRGSYGLSVPPLLPTSDNLPYYYVILALMLLTLGVLMAVIRSRIGLAFRAIGQNLAAAKASGINPTRFLVINFTLSCAFAGLLGGFYAHYVGILTPDVMLTSHTVEILAVAYIGGRGSLWGPAVIAFPLTIAVELARTQLAQFPGLHLVFYGLLLIVVMIYRPGGFAGLVTSIGNRIWRPRTDVPEPVTPAS
ncbi:MAG TPA: branched-chain amino acid ABC transporter permease [Candidatus Limnocylindrales bacterium]